MATQSQGTCTFCNSDFAKGRTVRRACSEQKVAIEAADGDGASESLYPLCAEDEWGRSF